MKSLRTAKLTLKRSPEGKVLKQLSTGFEPAKFERAEDAVKAVTVAQNSVLERHLLRPQVSKCSSRDRPGDVAISIRSDFKARPGSKLLAHNVAFETGRAKVRQIFSLFG